MSGDNSVNYQKYQRMQQYVQELKVRDVRTLFSYFRRLDNDNPNLFFPAYGLTAGEFTVMYVQNMNAKGRRGKRGREEEDEEHNDTWTGDDTL